MAKNGIADSLSRLNMQVPSAGSTRIASPIELADLHQQNRELMFQGVAGSTKQMYESVQSKFLEFCHWSQRLHDNGSPLPASE